MGRESTFWAFATLKNVDMGQGPDCKKREEIEEKGF